SAAVPMASFPRTEQDFCLADRSGTPAHRNTGRIPRYIQQRAASAPASVPHDLQRPTRTHNMSEVKKIRKNTAAIHTGGSVYTVALNYHGNDWQRTAIVSARQNMYFLIN